LDSSGLIPVSQLPAVATGGVSGVTGNPLTLVDNTDPANPIIQQDSAKADKVTGTVTPDNFAGLDASGNLTDSGSKAADFDAAGAASAVNATLTSHTSNTSNPHSVTLTQAEAAQSSTDLVVNHDIYKTSATSGNQYVTMSQLIAQVNAASSGTPMYLGLIKYGADTVSTMNSITGMSVNDQCGCADTQYTYTWDGTNWNQDARGDDVIGQYIDMVFWYGTWIDGIVYNGDPSARITCNSSKFDTTKDYKAGTQVFYTDNHKYVFTADHPAGAWTGTDVTDLGAISGSNPTWDLIVYADYLYDGEVTDNIIGNRSIPTGTVASNVQTALGTGQKLSDWLKEYWANINYLLTYAASSSANTSVTYAQFDTLRTANSGVGALVPGQWYLINDYKTIYR